VVIAFIGHNMVHQFEKWIFPFLGIVFGLATIIIMVKTNYALGFNSKAPVAFGGSSGAFILAIFIAYGYAVGWNPFASDYSRYLPKSSNPWRVGLAAGLGVFISCAVLEVAGAGAATIPTLSKIPTAQFTDPLPTVLQVLVLLGIGVGAVAANVLNIYSGAMSFLTLGIKFGLRLRRAISAVVFGAIGLIIGLVLQVNAAPGSNYENFLLVIAYWITPYLAVVIIDFFLRGGQYPESVFYVTSQRTWNGLIAMVAGILASTPFFNQTLTSPPKLWIGWFAYNHPEWGDLSFFVGFAVAALVYLGLYRLTGSQRTVAAAA
jgi:purine-cytosine permease-like protein